MHRENKMKKACRELIHYLDVTVHMFKMAVMTVIEYPSNIAGWLISNPLQFIMGFAIIKFVVEYYDESAPEHDRCEMTEHNGNVAKYRFIKNEVTAAEIIADLSRIKTIKDVSIEEAGIDDIIKIAYGQSG